jgi:hypothetical protein
MAEAEALAVMGASVLSLRPVALAPMLRLKAPQRIRAPALS